MIHSILKTKINKKYFIYISINININIDINININIDIIVYYNSFSFKN